MRQTLADVLFYRQGSQGVEKPGTLVTVTPLHSGGLQAPEPTLNISAFSDTKHESRQHQQALLSVRVAVGCARLLQAGGGGKVGLTFVISFFMPTAMRSPQNTLCMWSMKSYNEKPRLRDQVVYLRSHTWKLAEPGF